MIKPSRGRVLVKLLSATLDLPNKINLTLIDSKKHFDHSSRKGVVTAVGAGIFDVAVGDVVVFRGDAGFSLDGDPEVERAEFGEGFRWLKKNDLLAVFDWAAVQEDEASVAKRHDVVLQEAI